MKIDFYGMLYAFSYALDCIEHELIGVRTEHAKRVAYISTLIGQKIGFNTPELGDLAGCALMHDNALTLYISAEYHKEDVHIGDHCIEGEENLKYFPFAKNINGAVLYHHENADGSGPFHKTSNDTPLFSQLIHLADQLDAAIDLSDKSDDLYSRVCTYIKENRGTLFSSNLVNIFLEKTSANDFKHFDWEYMEGCLKRMIPNQIREFSFEEIKNIMDVFEKIVDYKSPYTSKHSNSVAEKAYHMGKYYHFSDEEIERFYIAAALHDIGKMAINNDILEKPDRLTNNEFVQMKNHAWFTYSILSKIKGFDDISKWASMHHEKLNGTGYPFGKKADKLTHKDRLLTCIDIYQALTEERSYKKGMKHESV